MGADARVSERAHNAAFMQALGAEFGMLQSARGGTISESSSRSGLYMTTLSSSVVALALVAQASRFGQAFFIFALAVLPVVLWRCCSSATSGGSSCGSRPPCR